MRYTILTGATGGIGREIAAALAVAGVPLILACRNTVRAEALADSLRLRRDTVRANHGKAPSQSPIMVLPLDLASEESVRDFVAAVSPLPIHALLNNAGAMAREFRRLPSGHEMSLTVNYYHTRLLTELLLPHIADGGAIVFTTSVTRFVPSFRPLPEDVDEEGFSQLGTYTLSKKLLTEYARVLEFRMRKQGRGVRVNCADPGVVDTGIIHMDRWFDSLADKLFRPLIRKPRVAARAMLRAMAAPDGGHIFTPHRIHEL